jgi:uncharacterized protein YlxW (UPF0749 family)
VLLLTNTVNLIGFILFNVLGRRNADYLAAITDKELAIEKDELKALQKKVGDSAAEIEKLKKRLADMPPVEHALVREVGHGAETAGTPASTSAAGTGLPIPAVATVLITNPLLEHAAEAPPSSPATPGAE